MGWVEDRNDGFGVGLGDCGRRWGGTYVAEDEEKDVEEGVGGADTALDPDC